MLHAEPREDDRRHFGMDHDKGPTLVYTVRDRGFLTVFFNLTASPRLGAFFYLVMDIIITGALQNLTPRHRCAGLGSVDGYRARRSGLNCIRAMKMAIRSPLNVVLGPQSAWRWCFCSSGFPSRASRQ